MTAKINTAAINEAALALLFFNLQSTGVAWKSVPWPATDRLYERGLIGDPAGRARSVELTREGRDAAKRVFARLFEEDAC